ncbi:energy-coupling factor transporter transmembrane protein EcfT [Fictibacillus sp. 5RED26]|uniref:energy-coupling factor transporter transmembrane component T family protein n=1 Tax=unclassified Fictibacillus TaxID=2644029 RepID=UPI0018CEC723|nr:MULTISPECIES: energy-coupling factor transporter transmembrane component T [unclassified Fictibacillus]MBH0156144.1 energy-coupling factor transporter transmembrane protein EcfT [Fictibacillus sp. 5RED26]MBH0165635.1 energy-coupling factor transporter transmembrane protein EcfT [Fictibacillus sp. 7GRE50]
MNSLFSGKYTWLHSINPSLKLLTILGLFILAINIHYLNFMVGFSCVILTLFIFGTGYSYKQLFLLSLPFLFVFLSTSSSMILFGKGETILFKWAYVQISEESLIRGIHLGFRALSFAMLGLIFALTTKPVMLFYSLMQQLKLPPKFAYSFMAAIRLIPIMIEEYQIIMNAQRVRGLEQKNHFLKRMQRLAIPLLSQSIRRAYRIAVSMEAKRFQSNRKRTFYYEVGFSRNDLIFLCYFLVLIGVAYLLSNHFPFLPNTDVRYLSD